MASEAPLTSQIYRDKSRLEYRFRLNRFQHIRALINDILSRQDQCRILDVGGMPYYWKMGEDLLQSGQLEITCLNLRPIRSAIPQIRTLVGDGRSMPAIADRSYDVCHSNSVIEHVGLWPDMQAMATEIRRVADRYFVQAPYFWFPYEPHFRAPLFHWLPRSCQAHLLLHRGLGFYPKAPDLQQARQTVSSVHLPTRKQFCLLFPDARIIPEKFGPLTKSLIAIR